jgi:hypothetical protein
VFGNSDQETLFLKYCRDKPEPVGLPAGKRLLKIQGIINVFPIRINSWVEKIITGGT